MGAGDLRTFNATLAENRRQFVTRGTFLLLEQASTVTYRTLFKKIYLLGGGGSQVKIALLRQSLKHCGEDIEIGEVECVLANLIFTGYIKGYISHQKATL